MTHNELRRHNQHGKKDRVLFEDLIVGKKWLVVSEKVGDLAWQVFDNIDTAIRAYEDIKAERGIQ